MHLNGVSSQSIPCFVSYQYCCPNVRGTRDAGSSFTVNIQVFDIASTEDAGCVDKGQYRRDYIGVSAARIIDSLTRLLPNVPNNNATQMA